MSRSERGQKWWSTGRGYMVGYWPEHPLANRKGEIARHRAVLYDVIGDGPEIECPDEWAAAVAEWASTHPTERPQFIELLAVEWGIGATDPIHAVRARMVA